MRRTVFGVGAALALFVAGPLQAGDEKKQMEIKDGVIDSIRLKVEVLPADLPLLIGEFSTAGADLGSGEEGGKDTRVEAAKAMKQLGPELLVNSLRAKLKESPRFQNLVEPGAPERPEEYLVLEGKFLKIDPGSRAKRYWGGFGAGKSGVQVAGVIKDASGKVLAEFTHMKHSGFGVGGGDYLKFLSDDAKDVGADIGEFLNQWAAGADLTKD
jgi:hypothetical protein